MIRADFPNGKSTKNIRKAIGIMLYFFGWGIYNASTMSSFLGDSLSFVDSNISRLWLLKPIILGDARLMNW